MANHFVRDQAVCQRIQKTWSGNLIVCPIFSAKTNLLWEKLKKLTDRDIFIITKSAEQNPCAMHPERGKGKNEHECDFVVFGDILDSKKILEDTEFFTRWTHEHSGV